MANLPNNFNNYPFQKTNSSAFLLLPQGIVYFLNNSLELANIPVNAGISVAFCFPEEVCYIKTQQGGAPAVITYKLTQKQEEQVPDEKNLIQILGELEKRLANLEKAQKKGGSLDEFL